MESQAQHAVAAANGTQPKGGVSSKTKGRRGDKDALAAKRRCVSTACIACRRRKSKCDGNTPSCAACASVYGTECVYDPNSDHRRKGVYKKDIDSLKTRNSTLQTLVQAVLNYPEGEVPDLVKKIRTCENLEDVAEEILGSHVKGETDSEEEEDLTGLSDGPQFERELSGRMGELRIENGAVRFLGGTSNLLFSDPDSDTHDKTASKGSDDLYSQREDAIRSWTNVTGDVDLIIHLLNLYFTWHYTYFTTLSKELFLRDYFKGRRETASEFCAPVLVNAMLALGCHFTAWPAARSDPQNSATVGDHFFNEAKRLVFANDEFESPRLATVQALALMSVREAGCGREVRGWVYSGMSFRMALDLGLNIETKGQQALEEQEVDARRITFWGCFLFDKCWSNYLGRLPQLPMSSITTPRFEVFPKEDSDLWSPWTDTGIDATHRQPARTRAVALQISGLCEISSDLMLNFYRPVTEKPLGRQAEVKKLSDFHTRLEGWRKALPQEMEPKEGQLPNVLVMHMFFHLLFIHLFRPFLKYTATNTPLPPHVSPRKMCTQAAARISKLLRLYSRTYGLRQVCNIVVYIAHACCTIHLLNLPDRDAARDLGHGIRQLDDIAEAWPCARRTLATLARQVRKWSISLPEDTMAALTRAVTKYGGDVAASSPSPTSDSAIAPPPPVSGESEERRSANVSPTMQLAEDLVGQNSQRQPPPGGPVRGVPPSGIDGRSLGNPAMQPLVDPSGSMAASSMQGPPLNGPNVPLSMPPHQPPLPADPHAPNPWAFTATGGPGDTGPGMGLPADGSAPLVGPTPLTAQQHMLFPGLDTLFHHDGGTWSYHDLSQLHSGWGAGAADARRDSGSTGTTASGVLGSVGGGYMDLGPDLPVDLDGDLQAFKFEGNGGMY